MTIATVLLATAASIRATKALIPARARPLVLINFPIFWVKKEIPPSLSIRYAKPPVNRNTKKISFIEAKPSKIVLQ